MSGRATALLEAESTHDDAWTGNKKPARARLQLVTDTDPSLKPERQAETSPRKKTEVEELMLEVLFKRLDSAIEREDPPEERKNRRQRLLLELIDQVGEYRLPNADVSELLQKARQVLGSRLVAYISGISGTELLDAWQNRQEIPSEETIQRLRVAHRAARMISDLDGPSVAQAWFQGMNPLLEERAPARVIREEPLNEARDRIFDAVAAFLAA